MSTWIIRISGQYTDHWEFAKQYGFWDMVVHKKIEDESELYFWFTGVPRAVGGSKSGPTGRLIGRATAGSEPFRCDGMEMPWMDDHTRYHWRVPLLDPVDAPLLGSDYGALAPLVRNQQPQIEITDQDAIDWLRRSFAGAQPPAHHHPSPEEAIESMVETFHMLPNTEVHYGPTDSRHIVKARQEQGYLRRHLLRGRTAGVCGICGHEFPANMLVAAHIKPRSQCSDAERWDFENCAMLCCLAGCDALFEKGYVLVDDGGFIEPGRLDGGPAVDELVKSLAGNRAPGFSPSRRANFSARHLSFANVLTGNVEQLATATEAGLPLR